MMLQSGQRAVRDWVAHNLLAAGHQFGDTQLQDAKSRIDGIRETMDGRDRWFPFRIYQVVTNPPEADDWLRFRVHAGRVFESDAIGTDEDLGNADPDQECLIAAEDAVYITVPANCAKFWLWLEIGESGGTTTAVVRYGDVPSASQYPASPAMALWTSSDPWTAAAKPDSTHIPIGWIDTQTDLTNKRAIIRQLRRSDVTQVGGGTSAAAEQVFRVKSYAGDYITAKLTLDGTTDTGDTVNIAVPWCLRQHYTSPQTLLDGTTTATIANFSAANQYREVTLNSPSVMIKEVIHRPYLVNDLVWAYKPGRTFVSVDSVELVWMDRNHDGRVWCAKYDQS
jgi:hypothetical protein